MTKLFVHTPRNTVQAVLGSPLYTVVLTVADSTRNFLPLEYIPELWRIDLLLQLVVEEVLLPVVF